MVSAPATTDRDDRIGVGWYAGALVGYVAIAYFNKTVLLNWIMGPLFLLTTLYLIPTAAGAVKRRLRRRTDR